MKIKHHRHFLTLISWLSISFLAIVGCSQTGSNQSQDSEDLAQKRSQSVELTVSAAASLQDAMKSVATAYQKQRPQTQIIYNFASSGTLTRQIEQGAPVDIFISANAKFMDELEKKNLLLPKTRQDLLKNDIVLIVPKQGNTSNLSNFQQLTNQNIKRLAIGEPGSVPAGRYAREVLTSLKIYDQLKPKIVFAKDVRQVLSYVELGNVDAGIVYATDAKVSSQVQVAANAPKNSHQAIVYPVAAMKTTKNPEATQDFLKFLLSDRASNSFQEYGFQITQ